MGQIVLIANPTGIEIHEILTRLVKSDERVRCATYCATVPASGDPHMTWGKLGKKEVYPVGGVDFSIMESRGMILGTRIEKNAIVGLSTMEVEYRCPAGKKLFVNMSVGEVLRLRAKYVETFPRHDVITVYVTPTKLRVVEAWIAEHHKRDTEAFRQALISAGHDDNCVQHFDYRVAGDTPDEILRELQRLVAGRKRKFKYTSSAALV